MDKKEKLELSESDISAKFITPAILKSGWDEMTQIRREHELTPGPVIVRGNMSARNKKKRKRADYMLQIKKGLPVAIIEAKANKFSPSHGMQQALGYADILSVPSVYSSNGDAFASHNKVAGEHEDTETELALDNFPSPEELWQRYLRFDKTADDAEKKLALATPSEQPALAAAEPNPPAYDAANLELMLQPYFDDGSGKEPRYYQIQAINRVVEHVARGQKRLLLVMATSATSLGQLPRDVRDRFAGMLVDLDDDLRDLFQTAIDENTATVYFSPDQFRRFRSHAANPFEGLDHIPADENGGTIALKFELPSIRNRRISPRERQSPANLAAAAGTIQSVAPSVVAIFHEGRQIALGTVIDTDGHVISKLDELVGKVELEVVTASGQPSPAVIVHQNEENDLAILKTKAAGLTPIRWATR